MQVQAGWAHLAVSAIAGLLAPSYSGRKSLSRPVAAFRIPDMKSHTREHRSLLANAERRLLIAIAHRLPAWVTSDQLTLLGLLSMVAAGLAFATLRLSWLNVFAFILA